MATHAWSKLHTFNQEVNLELSCASPLLEAISVTVHTVYELHATKFVMLCSEIALVLVLWDRVWPERPINTSCHACFNLSRLCSGLLSS